MRISDTLKKNWPFLLIGTLALAVTGTCFFFPPAFVAFLGFALASSPAFVALGTAASAVAAATVAFTMGAATLLAGDLARRVLTTTVNFFTKLAIARFSQAPVKEAAVEESSTEANADDSVPVTASPAERTMATSEAHEERDDNNQIGLPVATSVNSVSQPAPTKSNWASSLSTLMPSNDKSRFSLLAFRRPRPFFAAIPETQEASSHAMEMPIESSTNQMASPIVSPIRAATPVASPVRAATPIASPVHAATPIASPVRAATPVASPVRAATPVASPVRAATPIASPVRAATPVASPVHAATPVASPVRATTPVASPIHAENPIQEQNEANNKSLGERAHLTSSSVSIDDNPSTPSSASRRSAGSSASSPAFFDVVTPPRSPSQAASSPHSPNQVASHSFA